MVGMVVVVGVGATRVVGVRLVGLVRAAEVIRRVAPVGRRLEGLVVEVEVGVMGRHQEQGVVVKGEEVLAMIAIVAPGVEAAAGIVVVEDGGSKISHLIRFPYEIFLVTILCIASTLALQNS